MKNEIKIQFVDDWRKERFIDRAETLTDEHLDDMWSFAKTNQNAYPGISEFCGRFDEGYLARITKRAKMRALLEVKVPAPRRVDPVPSAEENRKTLALPRYIGTGARGRGSQLVPMLDDNGEITQEGVSLMLSQALQQMSGHKSRYESVLDDDAKQALDDYIRKLKAVRDKSVVRAAAA